MQVQMSSWVRSRNGPLDPVNGTEAANVVFLNFFRGRGLLGLFGKSFPQINLEVKFLIILKAYQFRKPMKYERRKKPPIRPGQH
jgi:hypothetical protein